MSLSDIVTDGSAAATETGGDGAVPGTVLHGLYSPLDPDVDMGAPVDPNTNFESRKYIKSPLNTFLIS